MVFNGSWKMRVNYQMFFERAHPEFLTLLGTGGVFNTPLPKISSKTLKMASKWPKISWLFLFLYDLSEKQKKILVFHSDFGCLEGGGGKHPPVN